MTIINFDYNDWNNRRDQLLEYPGSSLGFSAINQGIKIGETLPAHNAVRSEQVQPVVEDVIELLAGSLQWLRWYGIDAEDLQRRVRFALIRGVASTRQKNRLANIRAITDIADTDKIQDKLDSEEVTLSRR